MVVSGENSRGTSMPGLEAGIILCRGMNLIGLVPRASSLFGNVVIVMGAFII